jgi:succinoglycan biosynthesis transport protein ExoP
LTNQFLLAQSVLSDAQTRQRQMNQAFKKGELEQLPDILGNGLLQNMKADIVRSESTMSEVAQKYGKNHPQYKSAAAELQTLKAKFASEIQTATGSINQAAQIAAQRVTEVQQLVDQQKKRILQMRQERDNVTVLQREVDVAQRNYDALSGRATEIRLRSQLNQSTVAVLDTAAVPMHPYRPKPVLNLALALVFGSLLAASMCSSAELRDPRLREATGLLEVAGLPLLGRIPTKPRRRLLHRRPRNTLVLPAPARGG